MKDVEFVFDKKYLKAFVLLKHALISTPIMQPPDWSLPLCAMQTTML